MRQPLRSARKAITPALLLLLLLLTCSCACPPPWYSSLKLVTASPLLPGVLLMRASIVTSELALSWLEGIIRTSVESQ